MVGIPGSVPKTLGQKIASVVGASVVLSFIAYVIVKNMFFS